MTSAFAVYDALGERYVAFAGTEISDATEGPLDRSLLRAFVELVAASPGITVADIGCGPGRVAAFLAAQGIATIGIDPSRVMLDEARRAHPDIDFREGHLGELPLDTESLAGAVCWYSIMHTPPELLDSSFTELGRVLNPGGQLLLAFPTGRGEVRHRDDALGTGLPLTNYQHECEDVKRRLDGNGFEVHITAKRAPSFDHETTPQAFVIARRRSTGNPRENSYFLAAS